MHSLHAYMAWKSRLFVLCLAPPLGTRRRTFERSRTCLYYVVCTIILIPTTKRNLDVPPDSLATL